ncbi:MAG: InlB B-repeat-containing protein [Lachnospiraceae bacterium]|nr:InlB B-repeat-containing protein [Lachnospiraceae bacterium]
MKTVLKKTLCILMALTFILMMNVSAFAATDEEFTVTYLYGTKSVEQTVKLGGNGRPPRDTAVKGYTFIGWSDTARHVTKDMVILGMYTNNTMYKASTTAASKVKKFNNNTSAPIDMSWDLSQKGVPYETCVVRWYDGETNLLLKREVVPYGATLPDPKEPQKPGYEFLGWEGSWFNITEDRIIKSHYKKIEENDEIKIETEEIIEE